MIWDCGLLISLLCFDVGCAGPPEGVDECHGHRLHSLSDGGIMVCPESGWRYKEVETGVLPYLDWPEDEVLPVTEKDRGAGEPRSRGDTDHG